MISVEHHYTRSDGEGGGIDGSRTRRDGRRVTLGAGCLVAGVLALDAGRPIDDDLVRRVGFALTAVSAVGLVFLPAGLRRFSAAGWTGWAIRVGWWFRAGTLSCIAGGVTASLVDIPSILDPDDAALGQALGLPALVLVSLGLLLMRRAGRSPAASPSPSPGAVAQESLRSLRRLRRLLLFAGLSLFVQMPVNVALFVIPTGEPSFLLLAGGIGCLLAVIGRHLGAAATKPPRVAR
jgi:hypothetical protein